MPKKKRGLPTDFFRAEYKYLSGKIVTADTTDFDDVVLWYNEAPTATDCREISFYAMNVVGTKLKMMVVYPTQEESKNGLAEKNAD